MAAAGARPSLIEPAPRNVGQEVSPYAMAAAGARPSIRTEQRAPKQSFTMPDSSGYAMAAAGADASSSGSDEEGPANPSYAMAAAGGDPYVAQLAAKQVSPYAMAAAGGDAYTSNSDSDDASPAVASKQVSPYAMAAAGARPSIAGPPAAKQVSPYAMASAGGDAYISNSDSDYDGDSIQPVAARVPAAPGYAMAAAGARPSMAGPPAAKQVSPYAIAAAGGDAYAGSSESDDAPGQPPAGDSMNVMAQAARSSFVLPDQSGYAMASAPAANARPSILQASTSGPGYSFAAAGGALSDSSSTEDEAGYQQSGYQLAAAGGAAADDFERRPSSQRRGYQMAAAGDTGTVVAPPNATRAAYSMAAATPPRADYQMASAAPAAPLEPSLAQAAETVYSDLFTSANPQKGLLSAKDAGALLSKSGLAQPLLRKIWVAAKKSGGKTMPGKMNMAEFIVACDMAIKAGGSFAGAGGQQGAEASLAAPKKMTSGERMTIFKVFEGLDVNHEGSVGGRITANELKAGFDNAEVKGILQKYNVAADSAAMLKLIPADASGSILTVDALKMLTKGRRASSIKRSGPL